MSEKLSENISQKEQNLQNELEAWFNNLTEYVLSNVDIDYYNTYGWGLLKYELNHIIMEDFYEDYKTILGTNAIKTFTKTDEVIEEQLAVQEKEVIIDTLINYDTLAPIYEPTVTTIEPASKNIQVANKKLSKVKKLFQTTLDYFRKPYFINFEKEEAEGIINDLASAVSTGVTNTLETPDKLFKIIPNESVLEYLENRVFVATQKTMEKVGDNIYDIIKHSAEIEGQHPYQVAEVLRDEFTQLSKNESKKIARTEILRSKQEATWQRLNNNETVEYIKWIVTVVDNNSRDDHVDQGDMITYIGNEFPNGQRYPYDETGDPGDYINCRCDQEAFYPSLGLVPPPDMDCWMEEDMLYDKNFVIPDFTVNINY